MVHIPGKPVYRCGLTCHITVQLAKVGDYKLQLAIVHTAIIVVTKHVGGPPRPPASQLDRINFNARAREASVQRSFCDVTFNHRLLSPKPDGATTDAISCEN